MKATVFTWEYPPNIYGGAGVHAKYLTMALAKHIGVEVRTLEEGPPQNVPGVRVRRYRPTLRGLGLPDARVGKALEVLSCNLNMVSDPIESEIVHTHTWYTNFAGALAKRTYGCKLVATVHSLEPLRPWKREQLGAGYDLSSWMEKEGLEACDAVVAVSRDMKADILKFYGIPESAVHVIHNGVDPQKYYPGASAATRSGPARRSCGSTRCSRTRTSSGCITRPPCSLARPSTSRSGSSTSRRWRARRPSLRARSAGSRRSSSTGRRGSSSPRRPPPSWPPRSRRSSGIRNWRRGWGGQGASGCS